MADVAEVKDAFESQGYALDSKVIADEAFALCRQYNLDAFGLAIHWDQYSVENAGVRMEADLRRSLTLRSKNPARSRRSPQAAAAPPRAPRPPPRRPRTERRPIAP